MDFLQRHKRIFIIVAVIICIISIIATINYRYRPTFLDNALGYVITPVQKGATNVSRWVSSKLSFFGNISEIEAENERMKLEIDYLKTENKRLKLVESERKKLAELFKIKEKYAEYPTVGAETIASDTSNWFNTFLIDKGTNDGLSENMVVLSSGGLVGRIIKAGSTYSEVISLINIEETSSVSVKCLRTEELGIVKGDMELMKDGLCRMDYIDINAEIMEGDELVTSHLGEIYPPGITVGYVKEVKTDAKGLTKYAIVQPVVDFKHMETVLVIEEKYNSFIDENKD